MPRRFPPPWRIERIEGGYKVLDAEGQFLAYVYGTAATEEIVRPPRRRAWQTRSPEGECSRASIEIGAHPLLQGGVGCASIKPTICERVPRRWILTFAIDPNMIVEEAGERCPPRSRLSGKDAWLGA